MWLGHINTTWNSEMDEDWSNGTLYFGFSKYRHVLSLFIFGYLWSKNFPESFNRNGRNLGNGLRVCKYVQMGPFVAKTSSIKMTAWSLANRAGLWVLTCIRDILVKRGKAVIFYWATSHMNSYYCLLGCPQGPPQVTRGPGKGWPPPSLRHLARH